MNLKSFSWLHPRGDYRPFVESIADYAVFMLDSKGCIDSWNKGAEAIVGYRPEEILGRHFSVLFPKDAVSEGRPDLLLQATVKDGRHWEEGWLLRKGGTRFWAEAALSAFRNNRGPITGFGEVLRDATDRKKAEDFLREREREWLSALDEVPSAILVHGLDGRVHCASRGSEELVGRPHQHLPGKTLHEILPKELADMLAAHGRRAVENNRLISSRKRLPIQGGERTYDFHVVPLHDGGDKISALCCRATDVTESVRQSNELDDLKHELARTRAQQGAALQAAGHGLQREISERQKAELAIQEITEELEAFTYSLHHDLRAPLRTMCSFSELVLLESGDKLPSESRDLLNQVIRAAQRQDTLLRDLLAYCGLRTRSVRLGPVAVDDLVRDTIRERPDLQPPRVGIQIDGPLVPMRAHSGFLGQCISHLLENAAKFVAPGTRPEIRIWTERLADDVRLWIEDNGIGIVPHEQDKIFAMFRRLHHDQTYAGTGIGLAIVRKAARRMGGDVGVVSEVGKGSKFWIQLPRGDET